MYQTTLSLSTHTHAHTSAFIKACIIIYNINRSLFQKLTPVARVVMSLFAVLRIALCGPVSMQEDPITTLPGVLPWLWQLADEDIVRLPVPSGLAASVVVALKEVPEDCAALVGGNLPLLVSTLEWLWSLSAPSPSPPPASTRPHHRSATHAHAPATPPSGLPPVSPLSVHAAQQRAAAPDASTPRGSHRRRASKDGIHAMQAQLNAMQAELVNSPRVRG